MPKVSGFDMLDILRVAQQQRQKAKDYNDDCLNQAEDKAKPKALMDLYLVKSQVTLEDVVRSAKIY